MTRYLKALGLVLAAGLAMSAVTASAAWADKEFRSAEKHVIIKGSAVTESQFHAGGITVKCGKSEVAGTIAAFSSKELTLEASYENCTAFAGMVGVTIKTNGCDYVLTLDEGTVDTGGGATHTQGPVHINCAGGGKIEIIVGSVCTFHVSAQTPKGAMDSKLEGAGDTADIQTTSTLMIAYQRTGSLMCGLAAGEAAYTGSFTLKGFETGEKQVGIWIA